MFYFHHTKQTVDNASYHKGFLFEELLNRYLAKTGYDVKLTRTKVNSLEYDIEGKHRVDGRRVVGEAKAHETPISGQTVAAFVGKMLPLQLKDSGLIGLFLSTSALTPEAQDYLRQLDGSPYPTRAKSASELEGSIRAELGLPATLDVERTLRESIPTPLAQHIVHTDLGTYVCVTGAGRGGGFPDRFALLDSAGAIVTDTKFLSLIAVNLRALQGLLPVAATRPDKAPQAREVPFGLITADEWTDYRRPASKSVFVGRELQLERARFAISGATDAGRVVEIKARSGVGKSSFLAVLAEDLATVGARVELHDARDVRTPTDLLGVVSRFVGRQMIPSLEAAADALAQLDANVPSVFMVDQFESAFGSPDVFYAYEYLALSMVRLPNRATFLYARKDDLLTTHDDIVIDLGRLRGLSQSIPLDDLQRTEATNLIDEAAASGANKLRPDLRAQILEFAKGFPWLIKRTLAHITKKVDQGVRQQVLVNEGLLLEDLFEEELSELDEIERGYMNRLARAFPATYQELMSRFERDPVLPKVLDALTQRRLLRFSAGTYDTYNDVFKEYLIYERLPERTQASLFRLTPAAVVKAFRALGGRSAFAIDDFKEAINRDSTTSAYNVLRELRVVGLVDRTATGWVVPDVVRQYEHQGRLGEYVRRTVLKNQSVSDFVIQLEQAGKSTKEDTIRFLQDQFPFVDVSVDVWGHYANIFTAWLTELRLARPSEDGSMVPEVRRDGIELELGNLQLEGRGARPTDVAFLPSREYSSFESVVRRLDGKGLVLLTEFSNYEKTVCRELVTMGVAEAASGSMHLLVTAPTFEQLAKTRLESEPYSTFFALLVAGTEYAESLRQAFGVESLAESTRRSLAKKLANWGRRFGAVPERRLSFRRD